MKTKCTICVMCRTIYEVVRKAVGFGNRACKCVCVCDAYIMFTVTGRKYGTDGVGEDLQYDTL